jgi:hypothetical protein
VGWVVVPLGVILMTWALLPTVVGLGAGRGLALRPLAGNVLQLMGALAVCGLWFGAMLGVFWRRPPKVVVPANSGVKRSRGPAFWLGLAAIPLVLILLTALGVGVYLVRLVDRRLADAIAAADRDDPNWRLDALFAAREPVPDAENAAIPVAKVAQSLPLGWPTEELQPAFGQLLATPARVRLDEATTKALRDELDRLAEPVRVARGVGNLKRGRHEIELAVNPMETRLKETADAVEVGHLLMADAAVRAEAGDLDGALASSQAILAVARSIGDEPMIVSQVVRLNIGHAALRSTGRVLAQGEVSGAGLARLQTLVLDELTEPLFLRACQGERATLDAVIERVGDGRISIASLSGGGASNEPVGAIAPWGKLGFDYQRALGLEWTNALVAIAQGPSERRGPMMKAWEDEILRVKNSTLGPYVATLPVLMMPALTMGEKSLTRYEAELGSMAILLAAEQHRLKTSAWPESVAAIDSSLLPKPPLDPWTGRPFLLKHSEGRLVVYSVGMNGKDDHGAIEPRAGTRNVPDDVGFEAWDPPLRRQRAAVAEVPGPP